MLKLGYNEATCKENSTVENDLLLCEKYGYDYIELRLDMLQEYLKTHTVDDLKAFFAKSHIKPFAFNSIENINFCTPEEWAKLVELFTFGCKVAQQIGNPYIIVVPTVTNEICTRNEKEIFDVNSVRQALEIVNAVNRDSVGLTVDCINVYLHDKCADVDFIRKIPKEKLFVFHINDCEDLPLGILDHCHRLMPGLGAIPVQEVADAVQAVGYDGPACLELFRPEYWRMPAEDVIRMGAETTRPFLG